MEQKKLLEKQANYLPYKNHKVMLMFAQNITEIYYSLK